MQVAAMEIKAKFMPSADVADVEAGSAKLTCSCSATTLWTSDMHDDQARNEDDGTNVRDC